MQQYITVLKKHWFWVFLAVIVVTAASFGFSVYQMPKYRASVRLLVIQKQGNRLDAYTAARSALAVGEVLSKVIYTSSFYDEVMNSGFKIDKKYFLEDVEKQKKLWKETVAGRTVDESGAVQVDVYHPDPGQAKEIVYGIAYVMINSGAKYHGGGDQIEIKMIDAPLVSAKPVKPDILQNTVGGFGLSLLASVSLILLFAGSGKREENVAGQTNEIEEI